MAFSNKFVCIVLVQLSFLVWALDCDNAQSLKVGFYAETCPEAEAIVKKIIDQAMDEALSLSGPLLRMHFHDCFVRGCDGSVLLNSSTHQAERDSLPDQSLRGFSLIDRVKAALEKACTGVVSCADILAIVARDVVVATKGLYWDVETGRRDGTVSNITEALVDLPGPDFNITQLITAFQAKGLSVKDLVVLSGGHTIGIAHCPTFADRIYNLSGKGDSDPRMDPNYVVRLRDRCAPGDQTRFVEMDPGSFKTFDEHYYTLVAKRRGLLGSDAALLDNAQTRAYVQLHAAPGGGSTFFKDFGVSMVKMGRIGVLTGTNGQIRKHCALVN